uniref:Uncharacterized protein n=2 Tax=Aegilops tauschii subsp. strangulata TaxID=200361 RepID=A0A453S815_AEGTS
VRLLGSFVLRSQAVMFLFFGVFVSVQDPLVPKDWTREALPASDEEKGFAESTLLNQQLADGDDTDEELRRENTTSVNTLSSTASSHLTCCASCTGSTLCYPKI